MHLAQALRELRRKRLAVGCVVLVAALLAFALQYHLSFPPTSRRTTVGTATVRILVDMPHSQVVAANPTALDPLASRATLLASLMVNGVIKNDIAHRAGLQPSEIAGVSQSAPDPIPDTSAAPATYTLTTSVLSDNLGNQLPVIDIGTQGPSATGAARLANAAVAGLQAYLDTQATAEGVQPKQRLRVEGLGAAQASQTTGGTSATVAFGLALFVLIGGCGALLIIPRLRTQQRPGADHFSDLSPEDDELHEIYDVPAALGNGFSEDEAGLSTLPTHQWTRS